MKYTVLHVTEAYWGLCCLLFYLVTLLKKLWLIYIHLYLVVWPGHKAQAWRLESWDLYMITLENDEEEPVQIM